ncbi:ribonuclease HII [bacterium]|nr:ribonuclease HII [bacterium]
MQRLAGCDEVGRGPLAGPLVTAAVILPYGTYIPGLRDSKMLSHEERLAMIPWIKAAALAYAITEISLEELNSPAANINSLSLEGMTRSLKALSLVPSCAVVDGRYRLPSWNGPQKALIKGDNRCPVVAAASVLAKVHRDLIMIEADRRWPQYGFAENKGYGTARHLRALQEYGPCPWHRRHYRPISALLGDSPDAE